MRGEGFHLLVTAVVCCLKSNMVDLKEIGLIATYIKCVSVLCYCLYISFHLCFRLSYILNECFSDLYLPNTQYIALNEYA